MSWMREEDEKWLKRLIDEYQEAKAQADAAGEEPEDIERSLAASMKGYKLEAVSRGRLMFVLGKDSFGNATIQVGERTTANLSD